MPSAFVKGNIESREHGKECTAKKEKDYIDNYYHRQSDNYEPETWNLEGIVEDTKLAFYVGYRLSNSDYFPMWKPGSEFKRR